ncbi:MAG: prepilin-type N-terminal cleavage/methylation domain-containing protein, partial [Lysobacterales bacterium]
MKLLNTFRRQTGATLMEVLVAMSISLVVTASMVALMSNSLGSTTRIIKMTKLSDDMRVAMQMMTRDVRRTSFNSDSMLCYGNEDCTTDGTVNAPGDINMVDLDGDSTNDCFTFLLDRDFDDDTANQAGGFRRMEAGGVGVIEMWTLTDATTPDCTALQGTGGWVEVTDPDSLDITGFSVDDSLSYTEEVLRDINNNTLTQKVRKI